MHPLWAIAHAVILIWSVWLDILSVLVCLTSADPTVFVGECCAGL